MLSLSQSEIHLLLLALKTAIDLTRDHANRFKADTKKELLREVKLLTELYTKISAASEIHIK